MNYTVDWKPTAQATLATIWMGAADRRAVTFAQVEIDRRLAADPLGNGAPLSEGLYSIDVHPLRVLFELVDTVKFVKVVSVSELA